MHSSPNRVRLVAPSSDDYPRAVIDGVAGPVLVDKKLRAQRGIFQSRHGKAKPKGQHAYRRGLVR